MSLIARMREGTVGAKEISSLLGVCENTARAWIAKGYLEITPLPNFDEMRFDLDEVRRALATFKPPRAGRPPKSAK